MLDNLPATSTPARTLGEFACGLTFEHIPAAVLERAKLLILDALGCGIASNAYGFSDAALARAPPLRRCSVIGRANRLPVRDAALVNGMLIHGLDFDDTHLTSIIHATAACLPTALTFGEEMNVDGRVLLVAYAAGMETAIRVGAAAKGGFHHTGFHATGSLPISALASSPRACLISRPRPSSPPKASPPAPLPESRSSWKKSPGPSACTPAGPSLPASPPPAWPSTVSRLPLPPMRASAASSTPTSSTRRRPSTCRPNSPHWGPSGSSPRPPSNPTRSATSSTAAPRRLLTCTSRSTPPTSPAPRPFCRATQCPSSPNHTTLKSAPPTNTRPSSAPSSSSPPAC